MQRNSYHFVYAILIVAILVLWIIDRQHLLTVPHIRQGAAEPQIKEKKPKDDRVSLAKYKAMAEYEGFHRYLNQPNQIWITHKICTTTMQNFRHVTIDLEQEIVSNLMRLWKHEDNYNISEWGTERISSIDLAGSMLEQLRCSDDNEFRSLIARLPRFQHESDPHPDDYLTVEGGSGLATDPPSLRFPQLHQPESDEYKSFSNFLDLAFSTVQQ